MEPCCWRITLAKNLTLSEESASRGRLDLLRMKLFSSVELGRGHATPNHRGEMAS
jgi:hypothetical protein